LNVLYSSNKSLETKMTAKKKYFQDLALQYQTLKQNWGGENIYDNWMAEGWNNAKILTVGTYYDYVPYFEALIKQCSPDFESLYKKVMQLSQLKVTERREIAISFTTAQQKNTACR
jgi:predicted aminopeptidase